MAKKKGVALAVFQQNAEIHKYLHHRCHQKQRWMDVTQSIVDSTSYYVDTELEFRRIPSTYQSWLQNSIWSHLFQFTGGCGYVSKIGNPPKSSCNDWFQYETIYETMNMLNPSSLQKKKHRKTPKYHPPIPRPVWLMLERSQLPSFSACWSVPFQLREGCRLTGLWDSWQGNCCPNETAILWWFCQEG